VRFLRTWNLIVIIKRPLYKNAINQQTERKKHNEFGNDADLLGALLGDTKMTG